MILTLIALNIANILDLITTYLITFRYGPESEMNVAIGQFLLINPLFLITTKVFIVVFGSFALYGCYKLFVKGKERRGVIFTKAVANVIAVGMFLVVSNSIYFHLT